MLNQNLLRLYEAKENMCSIYLSFLKPAKKGIFSVLFTQLLTLVFLTRFILLFLAFTA